jgi:NADH-quinone oxidoreductase subunit C
MRDAAALFTALDRQPGEKDREITVARDDLPRVLSTLKSMGEFILLDIDAVDRPGGFEIAWRLLDTGGEGPAGVFTVKALADRSDPRVPSVMGIWKAADVLEREVWDLMGVRFDGRDRMKRILCREDFEGHPLRKDFVVEQPARFPGRAEGAGP